MFCHSKSHHDSLLRTVLYHAPLPLFRHRATLSEGNWIPQGQDFGFGWRGSHRQHLLGTAWSSIPPPGWHFSTHTAVLWQDCETSRCSFIKFAAMIRCTVRHRSIQGVGTSKHAFSCDRNWPDAFWSILCQSCMALPTWQGRRSSWVMVPCSSWGRRPIPPSIMQWSKPQQLPRGHVFPSPFAECSPTRQIWVSWLDKVPTIQHWIGQQSWCLLAKLGNEQVLSK